MADPGSIVGAVGLALQVVQGLKAYYSHFRSYLSDVEAVITRTTRLEAVLEVLEHSISKSNVGSDRISDEARQCVVECVEVVERLKKRLETCCKVENEPAVMKRGLDAIKKRVAYPFHKSTLEDLQKQLDRLLESLQVIVQALQLESAVREQHEAKCRDGQRQQQMLRVMGHQSYQTELLEHLDGQIDHQIQQGAIGQMQAEVHFANHSTQLATLHQSQISVEAKLDAVLSAVSVLGSSQELTLQTRQQSLHRNSELLSTSLVSNLGVMARHRSIPRESMLGDLACRCAKSLGAPRTAMYGYFRIEWTTVPAHLPRCVLYNCKQRSHEIRTGFRIPGFRTAKMVEAALAWGYAPLQCSLTYRNNVPNFAPAFAIFSSLSCYLVFSGSLDWQKTIPKVFNITLQSLSQLFQDGRASPSDVDRGGSNILHTFFRSLSIFGIDEEFLDHHHIDQVHSFIQTLLSYGIPHNDRCDRGFTPLDYGFQFGATELVNIPAISGLECCWSARKDFLHRSAEVYRAWAFKVDSNYEFAEDPFYLSILYRSKSKLIENLQLSQPGDRTQNSFQGDSLLLHASADWPEGLTILLAHGHPVNVLDRRGDSALDCAIELGNLRAIDVLLKFDFRPAEHTFYHVLEPQTPDSIRSEVICKITSWFGRCAQTDPSLFLRFASAPYTIPKTWFHEYLLNCGAADALYQAGFVDIDVHAKGDLESMETPLWFHSANIGRFRLKNRLIVVQWFLEKGAKIDLAHPEDGTTPAHLLAERIGYLLAFDDWSFEMKLNDPIISEKLDRLFHLSLTSPVSDRCKCHCSGGGCTPVSSALSQIRYYEPGEIGMDRFTQKQLVIQHMESIGVLSERSSQNAIIRVITFDQLRLTHTCHDHNHNESFCWASSSLTPTEVSGIHHSEHNELNLLEELCLEFETALSSHSGTTLDFIDGYWETRMQQVLAEKYNPRPNEAEEVFREVGVKLEPFGPEMLLETEPKYGSYEWFEWRVNKIMNGETVPDL